MPSPWLLGAAHRPDRTSSGWDFWWHNAANDVVAVFHGFGGGGGGQVFASWVLEAMSEPEGTSLEARARWPIERAHATGLARVEPKGAAGGTMACVAVGEDRAVIAHVGNARVYAVTSAGLELLTRDHTVSQSRDPEFVALREAHPSLDFLLRCVGSDERFAIDVIERAWVPGEVLALCTHNVWRTFGEELGQQLAGGVDAPAAMVRHMASHAPQLPAALAMVFPPDIARPAPRKLARPAPDSLVVLHAPDEALERRRFPLGATVTTIGRESGNDIVLDDESVSRRHARLERREDGWWLFDVSRHGTLVNGEQVREAPLRLHDQLHIGRFLLKLIHSEIPFEMRATNSSGSRRG